MNTKDSSRADVLWNAIRDRGNEDNRFFDGAVGTPFGIVYVYSQGLWSARKEDHYTRLTFIVGGQTWERVIRRAYAIPYLATLARRFAAEVDAQIPKPRPLGALGRMALINSLMRLMVDISRTSWGVSWKTDLEYLLWRIIQEPLTDENLKRWGRAVDLEHAESLIQLSRLTGGWFLYRSENDRQPTFVSIDCWTPIYEEWSKNQ